MLEASEDKTDSTEDPVKMARFVVENNYFDFNGDVKKQEQKLVQSLHRFTSLYLWMNLK